MKPCTRVLTGVRCCFTWALSVYSTLPKWINLPQTQLIPATRTSSIKKLEIALFFVSHHIFFCFCVNMKFIKVFP